MFFRCSHGSMSRRGSLPPTGRRLQVLRSRRGFTLAKQGERISAFTLAELLIATGVTAGLVVMLGWMLGSLMRTSSHATARVDAFRDARAALQLIERDLRNLVRTQWNPDPFTNPPPASTSPLTLPAAYFAVDNLYSDPATGNQQFYALVADKTTTTSGDVCAVGYYCAWDTQLHDYSLRRFFRGSDGPNGTLAVMRNAQQQTGYAADSVLYTPGLADPVLAAYVWNLKITMYNSSGTVINAYSYICDPTATTPNPLPAAIEISFNAMSPQAARTVMSVTSDPSRWMNMDVNLVKPHAYEFHSRINLP